MCAILEVLFVAIVGLLCCYSKARISELISCHVLMLVLLLLLLLSVTLYVLINIIDYI